MKILFCLKAKKNYKTPYIKMIILGESIFSLLKEINRKATLQNNVSNNLSPRRIEFRSDRIYINKKRGRAPQNEDKTKFHDNTQGMIC